jgi:hypothetical protein
LGYGAPIAKAAIAAPALSYATPIARAAVAAPALSYAAPYAAGYIGNAVHTAYTGPYTSYSY